MTIHIKDQTHNPNFLTSHCMIAVRSNKNNLYRQRDMGKGGGGGKGGREGCSSQVFPQLTTSQPHSQKFEHLL